MNHLKTNVYSETTANENISVAMLPCFLNNRLQYQYHFKIISR